MVCSGVARRDVAPAVGDRGGRGCPRRSPAGRTRRPASGRRSWGRRRGTRSGPPSCRARRPPCSSTIRRESARMSRALGSGKRRPAEQGDELAPRPARPSPRASAPRRTGGGRPPASSRRGSGPRSGCRRAARTASRSPGRGGRTSPPWASPPTASRSRRKTSSMSNGSLGSLVASVRGDHRPGAPRHSSLPCMAAPRQRTSRRRARPGFRTDELPHSQISGQHDRRNRLLPQDFGLQIASCVILLLNISLVNHSLVKRSVHDQYAHEIPTMVVPASRRGILGCALGVAACDACDPGDHSDRPASRGSRAGRLRPPGQADPEGALLRLPRGAEAEGRAAPRHGGVDPPGRRRRARGRAGPGRREPAHRPGDRDRPDAADAPRGCAADRPSRSRSCAAWIDQGAAVAGGRDARGRPAPALGVLAAGPARRARSRATPRGSATRSTRSSPRSTSGAGWCRSRRPSRTSCSAGSTST